jgi:hypothetical protein
MGDLDKDRWLDWNFVKKKILGKYTLGHFYPDSKKLTPGYLGNNIPILFKKSSKENRAIASFVVYIENNNESISLFNLKGQLYHLDMNIEDFES